MSLAPPPFHAWVQMPPVWRRWFQSLFTRVGGSPDTAFAPVASPTFTGTPRAPTAAVGTNSTQLATTAFVIGQAAGATPAMDGAAAAGASTRYARADHVHPTDTSRAPLASPAFTGTPTAPTPAAGDNSTKIATTAFLAAALPRAASIKIDAGAPGTYTLLWGTGISGVARAAVGIAVARITFSSAQPDANYAVAITRVQYPGESDTDPPGGATYEYTVRNKTVNSFDVATWGQYAGPYTSIEDHNHQFDVIVNR